MPRLLTPIVLALAATLLAGCMSQSPSDRSLSSLEKLSPSPELGPAEVVAIQMRALQLNDDKDRGIAVVFRFASPDNRRATGPLDRFATMIKAGVYAPMLNHAAATYQDVLIRGDEAMQRVEVSGVDGTVVTYVFVLSVQGAAPYRDCWLTDSVMVESVRPAGPSSSA